MSKVSDDWYDLPRAAAGIRLYQIRDELRENNLHDTEEPPLETSTAPAGGRGLQRPHERRHVQRPRHVPGWAAPACASGATCR